MIADGGLTVLSELPKEHFNLMPTEDSLPQQIESWLILLFGSFIAIEIVARILSARSPAVARWSAVSGGLLYLLVIGLPILMGLAGTHLYRHLDEPEQLIILQAGHYLPMVLFIFFSGALISAILSTVDSALLSAGSLLAHNLILPMAGETREKRKLLVNRGMVVVLGITAFILALSAESVHSIVYAAVSFGSAGIVVVYLFAFLKNFGGQWASLTALVLGTTITLAGENIQDLFAYPYLTAFLCALFGYIIIAGFERWFENQKSQTSL